MGSQPIYKDDAIAELRIPVLLLQMKTEKQKMLAGEAYNPMDAELVADRRRAQEVLKVMNESDPSVASQFLGAYGGQCVINPTFRCDYGYNIYLGEYVEINYDCVFLDIGRITIGNHVYMGPGVHLYAVNHPLDIAERRKGTEIVQPVTIGDDCWLGGGTIVCPGVTIGHGTTIGAGSVVTKDIPPNVLAVGNPCRVIRHLTSDN